MDETIGIGIIIGLITASSLYVWNSDEFTKEQKTFLLIAIVFAPVQWIGILVIKYYNNHKFENTPETKTEKKLDSNLSNLTELKEKGILTEEEYKNKVDKIEAEKVKHNLKNSVEYKQLKNLLDNGILSKEEFECKIQLLQNVSEKELGFKNNISITNSDTNNYIKNTLRKTYYKIDNKNYSIESLILELENNNLELWRNTIVELEDGSKKRLDSIKDLSFIIKKYFPPKN